MLFNDAHKDFSLFICYFIISEVLKSLLQLNTRWMWACFGNEVMFLLLSPWLQESVRFFHHLAPAVLWLCRQFPQYYKDCGGDTGYPSSKWLIILNGLGLLCLPKGAVVRVCRSLKPHIPPLVPIWFKRNSMPFRLLSFYDSYEYSHYINHAILTLRYPPGHRRRT